MEEYTTFFIIKKFGINRSTFKQWMDRGFIRASIIEAKGQGTKNLFSRHDLYTIYAFKKLNSLGLDQRNASIFVHDIPWDQVYHNGIVFMVITRGLIADDPDMIAKETSFYYLKNSESLSLPDLLASCNGIAFAFNILSVKHEVDKIIS